MTEEATTYTWTKPRNGRGFLLTLTRGKTTYIFLWDVILCFKPYVFCEILWQQYKTSTHEDFNVEINRCQYQFYVSLCDLSECHFSPPLAETLRYQVVCSLPTHYATNVALHTGTTLCKKIACLTSWPNSWLRGGRGTQQNTRNNKTTYTSLII
jgi:hypothetical protein